MTRISIADVSGALTFLPDAGANLMSWSWDLRPKGMLKLVTPLFAAVDRRQEQRIWSSLKAHLEAGKER